MRHVAALLIVVVTGCGSEPGDEGSVAMTRTTTTRAAVAEQVPSVERRTYLAAAQYFIDPAPTEEPTFSATQIRHLAPQLSDGGTVEQIVLGYFHDSANEPAGANPPLVYVVTLERPPCVPSSNAPLGETASPVIAVPCNVAVVVDATTGAQLLSLAGV
jgi:hypothetical protein